MSLMTAKHKELNAKFVEACFDGRHKEVDRLLAEGAFVESIERNGYSALSEACIAGQTIVVGSLLRALANPNSKANDGRTPLHRAAFHGWGPVVNLLLDHGADPKLRDESGVSAAELARTLLVKKQINEFPEEKTQEAQAKRKRQLAERPQHLPKLTPEADQATATTDSTAGDTAFEPPLRGRAAAEALGGQAAAESAAKAEEKAMAKAEKAAKAEAKRKAADDAAKADKERRQDRYKEAMKELREEMATSAAELESGSAAAEAPRPLTAKVEVMGAAEERLNGTYQVHFACKDRVEFAKIGDEQCQICWSSWQDEWRMLIGDYKMGSTLYRNNYRPNWKADECHGVPVENWQKWFGKDPLPCVIHLFEQKSDAAGADAVEGDATAATAEGEAVRYQITEECDDEAAETPASPSGTAATAKATKNSAEFLELKSNLNIVSVDDGAVRRGATAASGKSRDISLTAGGERIVETAEGLFGADEVQVIDGAESVVEEQDKEVVAARAWLERVGVDAALPASWESITAAKGAAQELYVEQKIGEACKATTAAIQALRRFVGGPSISDDLVDGVRDGDGGLADQSGDKPSDEEVESMRGTLHSNRSLLIEKQILEGDAALLTFGADAAWRLVVDDADLALRATPTNFKASFRRARALLELGDLDEALQDATNVVDHYASSSSTPNPEAAALREKIMNAIKVERAKWGEKGPRRWNHGSNDLIREVGGSTSSTSSTSNAAESAGRERNGKAMPTAMPWDSKPAAGGAQVLQRLPDSSKPLPAPRTSSDIEKALLTTLKEPARQLAYVREHLPAVTLLRFYKRLPLGPDLLARLVHICAALADEDATCAEELLCALATVPSAKTDAGMFDAGEQEVLRCLTTRFGSKAADAWAD